MKPVCCTYGRVWFIWSQKLSESKNDLGGSLDKKDYSMHHISNSEKMFHKDMKAMKG